MPEQLTRPLVLIVMGVSGCGKSTVGALLAKRLGARFADGDAFHPAENVAKMAAGRPLDDADRAPWLAALRAEVARALQDGEHLVLACSALRATYRDLLAVDPRRVAFIFLKGSPALLAERTAARTDHFMPPALLASQLATLEEPREAVVVDIAPPPAQIVDAILAQLESPSP
jgi:gluconokinase